jgi:hypothetical protein
LSVQSATPPFRAASPPRAADPGDTGAEQGGCLQVDAGVCTSLLEFFAQVTDWRKARGIRHRLATIVAIAAAAMLAGRFSYVGIGHWAAGVPQEVLAALGARYDAVSDRYLPGV